MRQLEIEMNYKDYNDYELISYIQENNEDASTILFEKYKPLIVTIATKMISYSPNSGLEVNDLIQEGLLGLNMAINSFNDKEEASFYTYARTCIERKMISAVIATQRQKHKILNESLSLEIYDDNNEVVSLDNFVADNSYNPENIIVENEIENSLLEQIKDCLTPLEQRVFELKKSGFKYKEIADILDKEPKSIDNALNRIKNKIKFILKQPK